MTSAAVKATIKSIQTLKVDPIVHPSLVVQGSSGTHDHSNFLIVKVILSSGIEGIGEVSGTLGWSGEDSGTAEHAIRTVLMPILIGQPISPVENLLSKVEIALAASPFTKAGVATALWDAYARSLDVTMADALGGAIRTEVPIKFSLSGDKARIKHVYEAAVKMGFGAFKLKIGKDPVDDGDRFAYARQLVGKDTFLKSLDCLQPFGLLATFGNSSGKVEPLDLGLLAAKGSLYVSRPTLFTHHIGTRERTQSMADDLFSMVTSGKVKIAIDQTFALDDVAEAHRSLEARKTTGCTILTL
jgi:hypothetical protein